MRFILVLLITFLPLFTLSAQHTDTANSVTPQNKIRVHLFDGVIVAGYVDYGAYINFTGPNISYSMNDSKIILGMLPSLRFKNDTAQIRNSLVMPTLGVGITYCYKFLAIQVPLYYNAKTSTASGRWHVGVGVGLRINGFSKKTVRNEKG